jgi:hypothetical protein
MKKQPYKWGATTWLRSMEIGETRAHNEAYNWRSLQALAARIERLFRFEVEYTFSTNRRTGNRYVTRTK